MGTYNELHESDFKIMQNFYESLHKLRNLSYTATTMMGLDLPALIFRRNN